jgi:DNA-binding ferritin-like protein (Dps family)
MQFSTNDLITIGLCVLMSLIGFFGYHKPFMKKIKDNPTQECDEPQAIASLGVLFTFIGISYGLIEFNSADIESSVPVLLGGMRTAFITSVIGMIWSMCLKYKQNNKEKEYYQQKVKVDNDATIGQLISYLQSQDEKIAEKESSAKQYQENLLTAIQEINKSLVGDGDASVITQIQLIKSKIQDGFESRNSQSKQEHEILIKEFQKFAETMAENNSKAFIEALNSTIRDFNEKIQEQFGENFKQLNIAVGKLLEWQDNYKNTVIEVTENQRTIFEGIEQAKTSLASMADHGNSIKASAIALGDILMTIDSYQKELEISLKDLASIGDEAKKLVPNIKSLVEETNVGISKTCENTNKELNENAVKAIGEATKYYESVGKQLEEKSTAAIDEAMKYYESVGKQLEEKSSAAIDETTQYYKKIGDEVASSTASMKSEYHDVSQEVKKAGIALGDIGQQVLVNLQTNGDNIEKLSKKSVQTVDKQMNNIADTLNNTVNEMLKVISKHESEVDTAADRAIEAIKGASDKLQKSALEVTQRVSDNLTQISKDNNEELKQQQKNMAKNFEDAMSKALYAFGNEMAKISQKFAADYTPLADKLREILRIAEQTQRRGNRG